VPKASGDPSSGTFGKKIYELHATMSYYILKDLQKTGPYTREDILAMFEAKEVDNNTSIMHSGLPRWFPLNKLKDVFIKGEDKDYFMPAFGCNPAPPPPVIHRNGPLPRPTVPQTQREQHEELEQMLNLYKMGRDKPKDNSLSIVFLLIVGAIALLVLVQILLAYSGH
jgi:hypothetical protein